MTAIEDKTTPYVKDIEITMLRNLEELRVHYEQSLPRFQARMAAEQEYLDGSGLPFQFAGFCRVCMHTSNFAVDYGAAYCVDETGLRIPNWRETLICQSCGLINRVRCSLDMLLNRLHLTKDSRIYATEQLTPFFGWLKARYPDAIGSEFLGADISPGSIIGGLRHEDFTKLSFADDSLDFIVSFDVLEHVPDYRAALAECLRCLKPGGKLLISAPFSQGSAHTIVRARITELGEVEHILPPEYHGNPTRPEEGSLCFYHFGWDLLEDLRKLGAFDAYVVSCYSYQFAYLGYEQLFIVVTC